MAKTEGEFDQLIDSLAEAIEVTTGPDDTYTIRYANADSHIAVRVVDALLNLLVERTLGDLRRRNERTLRFLEEEITRLRVEMEETQRRAASDAFDEIREDVRMELYRLLVRRQEHLELASRAEYVEVDIVEPPRALRWLRLTCPLGSGWTCLGLVGT